MADGGGRANTISKVEIAARMLAAGNGTGSPLSGRVDTVGAVPAESRGEVVGIRWKGTREEGAARSIDGGTRATALHGWSRAGGVAALPSFRPDHDAVAAMSHVEAVPAALLRVYALQAWHDWPLVERAALVVITGKASREAVCDAMGRILWRVAAVSQDERAKQLRMRASDYRALTRDAGRLLWRWLNRAASQLLAAMKGTGESNHRTRSDPCGSRAETWWHPERKWTDSHPAVGMYRANTTPFRK